MDNDYDRGYSEAWDDARALVSNFLKGQSAAERAQGTAYKRGEHKYKQTDYIRESLDRFLKGFG